MRMGFQKNYRFAEIVRKNVITAFLSRFMHCNVKVFELWLVSPWLSIINKWDDYYDSFSRTFSSFLNKIRNSQINVTIITRPPEVEQKNLPFLENFKDIETAKIITTPFLHSKIYICENIKETFALIGSPNLTAGSLQNIEIGLLIRSLGEGKRIISELTDVCNILLTSEGSEVIKKRGKINLRSI